MWVLHAGPGFLGEQQQDTVTVHSHVEAELVLKSLVASV